MAKRLSKIKEGVRSTRTGVSKAFGNPLNKIKRPTLRTPTKSQMQNQARFRQMIQQRQQMQMQTPVQQISPNTKMMLANLRYIQQKAKRDDLNQQRVHLERKMVSDAGNLMNTPNLFGADSNKLNILDMQGNILQAENVFAERTDNRIMQTNRPSLLNTKEVGNNLNFGTA